MYMLNCWSFVIIMFHMSSWLHRQLPPECSCIFLPTDIDILHIKSLKIRKNIYIYDIWVVVFSVYLYNRTDCVHSCVPIYLFMYL